MSSDRYQQIYRWVRRIPAGRVATYGQIARLAGFPNQARQVGYALHALPEDSPVPWHRVVNAKGQISRRVRPDAELAQLLLLQAEGIDCSSNGRIVLDSHQWQPGRFERDDWESSAK